MNKFGNSESIRIIEDVTLDAFLESRDICSEKGIAIAVNNTVVSRQEWDSCQLKENDNVLIISAT